MSEGRTAPASLGLLMGRVEHLMTRRVEAALGGPTVEQWRVLDLLSDGEGHAMSEIAAHAMVPPPTLTKIVDRLIEAALVYRRPDEADRRRILVFLSERGKELHSTLAPRVAAAEQEFVTEIDEADLAHLARLLERLGR